MSQPDRSTPAGVPDEAEGYPGDDDDNDNDNDNDDGGSDGAGDAVGGGPTRRLPLVLPTILPAAPPWATVFGRDAPLEVELGFGRPHFLLERAAEAPHHDIVGIEWKGKWPQAVWRKQERGLAGNVRALHGNAWLLFGGLFAEESLQSIYLNFPDPWWKAKHKKRRIVQDSFAALLSSRLQPGGMMLIQTDVASLLEEYLERLEAQPALVNPFGRGRLAARKPVGASSHREKKCRSDGVPIFRGIVVKRNSATA